MSGVEQEVITSPCAMDVDARAAQFLIKRRNRANWSADDQTEFDAWLSQSLAHKTAYWRLEVVWDRADRLSVLRPALIPNDAAASSPRSRARVLRITAAVMAIAAIGTVANFLFYRTSATSYSTPLGGHMAVKLADGSRVELNTDTVLRAWITGRERYVTLEKGEAYFQIKHDRLHPFFVTAAGHRIVDLGTKFLVRREADRIEVALVEGRARIETSDASLRPHAAELKPGDFAVATTASLSISRETTQNFVDQLGWRRGVLVFHHMALADAAAEFNRYNSEKLVVVGPSIARLEIVGTFPANDIGLFSRAVKAVLGLNVERQGAQILISR